MQHTFKLVLKTSESRLQLRSLVDLMQLLLLLCLRPDFAAAGSLERWSVTSEGNAAGCCSGYQALVGHCSPSGYQSVVVSRPTVGRLGAR